MSSPHESIGRLIGEHQRYRLDTLLGSGGMGQVFLAKDTVLGKQVALKLLNAKLSDHEGFRKRFEREVSICAALDSHHIVRIEDYGISEEGYPFFVMEHLTGETLGQRLRREQQLSVEKSVAIITQICAGLKIAHQGVRLWRQGQETEPIKIIHRDLKPENIFLVPTVLGDLVKILDFGIAKVCADQQPEYGSLTGTDMFIGTFDYASPEQISGSKQVDERSDIYSLGMILYQMLSGTDPFGFHQDGRRTNSMDWALAHAVQSPVPLRSQPGCQHLSVDLERVVMRCLAKNPQDRFASVDELCQALQIDQVTQPLPIPIPRLDSPKEPEEPEGTQAQMPILVSNSPPAQKAPSSPPVLLIGILLALVTAGGGYGAWQWLEANKNSRAEKILKTATALYLDCGETEKAIALLKTMPTGTQFSPKTLDLEQQWRAETQQNNQSLNTASVALINQEWDLAIESAQQIAPSTPYWTKLRDEYLSWAREQRPGVPLCPGVLCPPCNVDASSPESSPL